MVDLPLTPTTEEKKSCSFILWHMNEKFLSNQFEWQSWDEEEQEGLKQFFALLHRIDCRLEGAKIKNESEEEDKTRDNPNRDDF